MDERTARRASQPSRRPKASLAKLAAISWTAVGVLTLGFGTAVAQLVPDAAQACAEIDAEFARRLVVLEQAVKPTPLQIAAWTQFEHSVRTAQGRLREPCSSGSSGIALQLKMMSAGPEAMGMVQRAADKLKTVLSPEQRQRLTDAME